LKSFISNDLLLTVNAGKVHLTTPTVNKFFVGLQAGSQLRTFANSATGVQLARELGTTNDVIALVGNLALGITRDQIRYRLLTRTQNLL